MFRPLFFWPLALLAALTLAACNDEATDTHPDQLVSKRQAVFKKFTVALEPLVMVANQRKDFKADEVLLSAQALQALSTQPWAYFTADGNYPPTRAKPEVWQKPAEFKQAQDAYLVQVGQLLQAAQTGKLEAVAAAVNGVERSCKACHTQFRKAR